jgi:iron(III) transport system permease protein
VITPRGSTRGGRGWTLAAVFIALPLLLPLLAIAGSMLRLDAGLWSHFFAYLLPEVTRNTLVLLLGVGVGVTLLGTAAAALVALCEFPGRRGFAWLLLLPLAMPGYVLATVVIGLLDYAGPLARLLREFGLALPPIRSTGGLILTLSLTLYPYVYLVARAAFASQGAQTLDAARLLGLKPWQAFRRVALPQARPWILGGTLLALMETLADFGTVSAFGYSTFTTAIYRAWFSLFSIDAALQLAAVLLLLVLGLVLLEQRSRGAARYERRIGRAARLELGRWRWCATGYCGLLVLLGFAGPAVQLLLWTLSHGEGGAAEWPRLRNAVLLASLAAVFTAALALLLATAYRRQPGRIVAASRRIATLGYALPGPLLALGLYVPYAGAIGHLNRGLGLGLAAQGGLALLLLAYALRFLAVAHTPLSSQYLRLSPQLDDATDLLGVTGLRRLWTVYLPPLRGALGAALLLVFVDVMKEMPITLMMRPFGWDTLAVRVFELTREGEWQRAAQPSLVIVAMGLLPVIWLSRSLDKKSGDET